MAIVVIYLRNTSTNVTLSTWVHASGDRGGHSKLKTKSQVELQQPANDSNNQLLNLLLF